MTAVRVPISAALEITMVTRGRAALVLSVTVPLMAPVMAPTVWPVLVDACSAMQARNETRRRARRRPSGLFSPSSAGSNLHMVRATGVSSPIGRASENVLSRIHPQARGNLARFGTPKHQT